MKINLSSTCMIKEIGVTILTCLIQTSKSNQYWPMTDLNIVENVFIIILFNNIVRLIRRRTKYR